MLIPILGRAGSGKTTLILKKMEQAARQGSRVLLIVPEQFSFEMEKAVFERLGGELAMQAEVYSFTRLCHHVFLQLGGMAGEYVSDAARQIGPLFPAGKKYVVCRNHAASGGGI